VVAYFFKSLNATIASFLLFLFLPLALLFIIDFWGMPLYSNPMAKLYINSIISFTGSYWLKCTFRILPA
jgi:hypothetical protein